MLLVIKSPMNPPYFRIWFVQGQSFCYFWLIGIFYKNIFCPPFVFKKALFKYMGPFN